MEIHLYTLIDYYAKFNPNLKAVWVLLLKLYLLSFYSSMLIL